ncbi:MAG: hypothetical protein QM726_20340 [Chitinophagaceae bacterium]
MIKLKYENLVFDEHKLPDFVATMNTYHYGKKIILKDKYASGDYKLLEFANGFYAYVSNYILREDFELELSVAREDYLALHINQIQAGAECKISLNGETLAYDDKVITSIFLTAPSDSFVLSGSSGACVNRLKIVIPKKWLFQQIPSFNPALLDSYLQLDQERLSMDAIDPTYRSMVDKVMNTEDSLFYLPVAQNVVALIAERFFNRLATKLQKKQKGNEWSDRVA